MTWGIHPAITFDKALTVGQQVNAHFTNNGRVLRFRARIVKLNKNSVVSSRSNRA